MLANSPFDINLGLIPANPPDTYNDQYTTTRSEQDAIENWLATVCNHNSADIVKLYANEGVLLGTVAKEMKVGRSKIKEYFDMFVKKKPCGEITSMNVQRYGDMAVVDGTYIFEMNVNGGREEVPARYTFVLRKKNHRWLIVSHHSSAQP
tara:strand:+ start:1081 stop:1530 length:450 start_codon:yes stop_codon:yes gene_type:complete